jgi:hypothetical protein
MSTRRIFLAVLPVCASALVTRPGPQGPAIECRLEVVPAHVRRADTVEFRYVLTGPAGERVSGRYLHEDEELFGASLRLRTASGEEYRFLRTPYWSYRGYLEVDEGEPLPGTYRFRFPLSWHADRARVVPARGVATGFPATTTAFDSGARELPIGSFEITAVLPSWVLRTADRVRDGALVLPRLDSIPCRPARLVVSP